jgi:hypothetical protein
MHADHEPDPAEEAALDAALARAAGDADVARLVVALRRHDQASAASVERHLDAVYEAHAETTRRRGPLDFFAARWERSTAFKIVAASLLAHALALPVVAYLVLEPQDEPRARITFEPVLDEPLPPAEATSEDVDVANAFDPERLADLARIEAWRSAGALVVRESPEVAESLEHVLRTRLALLAGAERAASVDLLEARARGERDAATERAVAELALDVELLEPAARPLARRVLEDVLAAAAGDAAFDGVRGRARAYGLSSSGHAVYTGLDLAAEAERLVRELGSGGRPAPSEALLLDLRRCGAP